MDIIGRIDETLEAWEHGPDAARWTPDGGNPPAKTYTLVSPTDAGQVFFAPAGTTPQDLGDWSPLGTIAPGPAISTALPALRFEVITHDDNGEPFTITPPALLESKLVHAGWCLECTDGEQGVELFATAEDRTEWMAVHKACTDHDRWRLLSFRDTTVRA